MTPGSTGQAGSVDPTGQVVVTLKDVWFAQQDTTAKLTGAVQDINLNLTRILGHVESQTSTNEGVARTLADHEGRLRALERWRYALPTAVLLGLGSAVGTVIAWLQVIHH